MRLSVILGLCIVLCGAVMAQAEAMIGTGAIPTGAFTYTRTPASKTIDGVSTSVDLIKIYMADFVSGSNRLQLIEGTWTTDGAFWMGSSTDPATWQAGTKTVTTVGIPARSGVNMLTTNNGAEWSRTQHGTASLFNVLSGSWYTDSNSSYADPGMYKISKNYSTAAFNASGNPDADPTPIAPFFDSTLLASFTVLRDSQLTFTGHWGKTTDPNGLNYNGGWGFEQSVNLGGSISTGVVPEPAALLLTCSGLVGLVCYAWRKRR